MDSAEDAPKLVTLGQDFVRAGEFEKAEACFDRAVAADVGMPAAWLGLSRCQRERRTYAEAERSCRHAIALDETSVSAWVELSEVQGNQKKWPETESACEHALTLDPNCAKALANLAVVRGCQSRAGEARELIERALALDASDKEAWYVRGTIRYRSGDLDGASEDARAALAVDRSYGYAWALIASVLHARGATEEAASACREGLSHAPKGDVRHALEGALALIEGRHEDAVPHYKRLAELDSSKPDYAMTLGTILFNLRRRNEALEPLKQVVRLDPQCADAHFMLGYLYLFRQDDESARKHLKALRKLNSPRADQLRRAILPWDERHLHGYGLTLLFCWVVIGGIVDTGTPLIAHPLYLMLGVVMLAGYVALAIRIRFLILAARREAEQLAVTNHSACT